jgi:hypothetical protein
MSLTFQWSNTCVFVELPQSLLDVATLAPPSNRPRTTFALFATTGLAIWQRSRWKSTAAEKHWVINAAGFLDAAELQTLRYFGKTGPYKYLFAHRQHVVMKRH